MNLLSTWTGPFLSGMGLGLALSLVYTKRFAKLENPREDFEDDSDWEDESSELEDSDDEGNNMDSKMFLSQCIRPMLRSLEVQAFNTDCQKAEYLNFCFCTLTRCVST
jgi:hypothetical protein